MNRKWWTLAVVCLLALTWVGTTVVRAQDKPLTNAEIVKLAKADLGDEVIIAKIKSATAVKFDTGTDDLVKLREAGVSKAVIAAMLDRSSGTTKTAAVAPAAAPIANRPGERVTLHSTEGDLELPSMFGLVKTQTSPFSVTQWVQFEDLTAKVRIRDRRPTILLASDKDPRGGYWVVQMSVYDKRDEKYRYFDLENAGSLMWGAAGFSGAPEKGSVIKYDAVEEQPGLWRITPQTQLKPGEYGLFSAHGQELLLFAFGIDR